ncbi:MAG: glycogen debranching N-terminal domain-containing protein [Actinomycetota bacterium]|nr:glycogen debranching N-terminal domain-containing protein [Actinomycetota bacterium]
MSDAPSPFAGTTPVASLAHVDGAVTLVEGQTFCVSGRTGDMAADFPHGLFVFDTRVLSQWELRLNGHRVEPLTVEVAAPYTAVFCGHGAPAPGHADADVVMFRHRHIGQGMRERLVVTNHGLGDVALDVELRCDVDFADLFEVKESRVRRRGEHSQELGESSVVYGHRQGDLVRRVTVGASAGVDVGTDGLRWRVALDPGDSWETCVEVSVVLGGTPVESRFTCDGADHDSVPLRRMATWRATLPTVETDDARLAETFARSGEDLGALRIFDPDHPELPILAAGAPWFMTVFGRDSLLTAWMTLIADSSLAHGVLETLARFQGRDVDPATEEEPGKILHEMRFGSAGDLSLGGGHVYYGSIDATPLFVMLVGELRRWDTRDDLVERLLPHVDRALAWIEHFGDRDGDGYVEYHCRSERGLANQGWKDSWDAIRHADGRLAEAPIALCEVQAYTYAAYTARAHFAREAGDAATFERYAAKAKELRRRFNEDFWVERNSWYALGLDADKRPIDALASNVGHCLWAGIVEPDRAAVVARRLMSDEMFSGYGVRTLATSMPAYNPVSYHNGSVWPHDNALCAAGLARYGFVEEAHRIITAQLDVAHAHRGRLPELFAGFDRRQLSAPAGYPTSCSPQAWAAASPLLWLRTLLRLDPWVPAGRIWIAPELPETITRLRVAGIRVAHQELTVTVEGGRTVIDGARDLEVVPGGRPPLTTAFDPDGD